MNPVLIVLGGFAGAGKTTIATRLSKEFKYPVVSTDYINDALRVSLNKTFREVSSTAYEVAWHLIRQNVAHGLTTILDTNMCSERVWETLDTLKLERPNLKVVPIILRCTFETHKKRIEFRGRTNKNHLNLGGDALEDIIHKYDFMNQLKRPDIIEIDANGDGEQVYNSAVNILRSLDIIPDQS